MLDALSNLMSNALELLEDCMSISSFSFSFIWLLLFAKQSAFACWLCYICIHDNIIEKLGVVDLL
jgi:hypothetical protein